MEEIKKEKRGGYRPGAGRKRSHEYPGDLKNVTIRVPQAQIDEIAATGIGTTVFYIQAGKEKLLRLKELSLE